MIKQFKKNISKIVSRVSIFDVLISSFLIICVLMFFLFFYRKSEFIEIQVKVTDQDILYASNLPQNWYAQQFKVGDLERDVAGRVIAEITAVDSFSTGPNSKEVYLGLRVKATYSKNSNSYHVMGKKIVFGSPMRFHLGNVTFDGYVTNFPGLNNEVSERYLTVYALGEGVHPEIANKAPNLLTQIVDTNNQVLADVLRIDVFDAVQVTQNYQGDLLIKKNPFFKDMKFVVRVKVIEMNGQIYMFGNRPIVIGEPLPLNFDHISLFPMITDIAEIED